MVARVGCWCHQIVLLAIDGLGWEQLQERRSLAPTLASMDGGPITTVAPSTTSTAMTSFTTGLTPGEHGIIGYRIHVHQQILNVLRWSTAAAETPARRSPQPSSSRSPRSAARTPR